MSRTVVPISQPVQRDVTEYVNFTGRTEATLAVNVRARVTGQLTESLFKEGADVRKGDTLFVIDPRHSGTLRQRCRKG